MLEKEKTKIYNSQSLAVHMNSLLFQILGPPLLIDATNFTK